MSHYHQVPSPNCLPCCFYDDCAVDGVMFFGIEQVEDIVHKCKKGYVWKEENQQQ